MTGAYSLTFGGLLLTAGALADRLGRRRVLLWGLAAFGLISLGVLAVHTTGDLIVLRACLGLAAAAMAPITNSLVFRLFDDEALKRRAMTLMITVGMSGFILGPLLGGTLITHLDWRWLLLINAPIAVIAWLGVRAGVSRDDAAGLTQDRLDVVGSALSIAGIGLACYTLTSGVDHGWGAPLTVACALGAVAAVVAFIRHERRTAEPMLDLTLFRSGTFRGATIAQMGTSIAMAGLMFSLIFQFQYAYGWSPLVAGLANLPLILTMLLATPLTEALGSRVGHRRATLIGGTVLAGSLLGMGWAVSHGYLAVALLMVTFTFGLRTVMTICAVALVEAMPANRTSLGTAMNDTAQEVGTSIGTAVTGTLIAVLVTVSLPTGTWSPALVASFFHGEAVTFVVVAVVAGVLAIGGALALTDSTSVDEHAEPASATLSQ
ncbi:MFS transporter [Demequina litorisediminis]|uniref:MFS transporter n=1 Tax=Demequina litorisediminis TaxID=1849022 RepID=A0ABQ6IC99_9MICO|nr:MFS transporter [Demequina litorisediminis]